MALCTIVAPLVCSLSALQLVHKPDSTTGAAGVAEAFGPWRGLSATRSACWGGRGSSSSNSLKPTSCTFHCVSGGARQAQIQARGDQRGADIQQRWDRLGGKVLPAFGTTGSCLAGGTGCPVQDSGRIEGAPRSGCGSWWCRAAQPLAPAVGWASRTKGKSILNPLNDTKIQRAVALLWHLI